MADKTYWDEVWKPVIFEGIDPNERYEISNYGRVRKFNVKLDDWKVHKPANVNGYAYFSFRTVLREGNRNRITKSLHRLVAENFVGSVEGDKSNVIHKDFDKWNNHENNLEWVSKTEMFAHSRKSPRTAIAIEKRKGEITNSKLTATDVMRLKKKLKRGSKVPYPY